MPIVLVYVANVTIHVMLKLHHHIIDVYESQRVTIELEIHDAHTQPVCGLLQFAVPFLGTAQMMPLGS